MKLTTGMSLTATTATGCMKPQETDHYLCNPINHVVSLEEDSDQHGCFNNSNNSERVVLYSETMKWTSSFPVEDKSYSAPFHPPCNDWLAFWLFLVASSYFFLSKNVNSFLNCRTKKHADNDGEEVSVNSMFRCSERSWLSNTIPSKCETYSEISDFDRTSYFDSLLSLEEEDSDWLSDSKPYGCNSNENPSTPVSYKCDSFSEVSDLHSPTYWESLLKLDSVQDSFHSPSYRRCNWGVEDLPSISTTSSLTGVYCDRSEDDSISVENLIETSDIDEFSADEPLFWPFEGEQSWDSEDSWSSFCSSPRKRLVFDSGSTMSSIRSAKVVPFECEDEKVLIEHGKVLEDKLLSVAKVLFNEDYAPSKDLLYFFGLDQELLPIETLMGLNEFDGHEGLDLDSEFNGDFFMLDDFNSTT